MLYLIVANHDDDSWRFGVGATTASAAEQAQFNCKDEGVNRFSEEHVSIKIIPIGSKHGRNVPSESRDVSNFRRCVSHGSEHDHHIGDIRA